MKVYCFFCFLSFIMSRFGYWFILGDWCFDLVGVVCGIMFGSGSDVGWGMFFIFLIGFKLGLKLSRVVY